MGGLSVSITLGDFPDLSQKLPWREDRNSHVGPQFQKVRVAGYDPIDLELQGALETPNSFGIVVVRVRTHAFDGRRIGPVKEALARGKRFNQGALLCLTDCADLAEDLLNRELFVHLLEALRARRPVLHSLHY